MRNNIKASNTFRLFIMSFAVVVILYTAVTKIIKCKTKHINTIKNVKIEKKFQNKVPCRLNEYLKSLI